MEKWRDIPGYEGLYQASNMGQIRTCEGKTTSNARYGKRVWKQRIMKQKYSKNRKGRTDARVILWKDGKERTWLVSRLVALTWCEGYADGLTVNHINGNPLDNSAPNLEWVTIADNVKKGFDTGLFANNQKAVALRNGNGEIILFASMAEASRHIGKSNSYISNYLKKNINYATDKNGNKYEIRRVM